VRASDVLILHGRRICRPAPLCDRCAVRGDCQYYRTAPRQG
jgi:endonuclease III